MMVRRPHLGRAPARGVPAIGVEVGAACVRAVVLRAGAVVWEDARPWTAESSSEPTDAPRSLDAVLTGMLIDARAAARRAAGRWGGRATPGLRPPPYMALAPRFAQFKRLTGLPGTPDARVATEFVHEHAGRLFLKNGTPIVTGGVRALAPDYSEVWAGAYHSPVVADIVWACARAGTRFVGLASVAAVVGHALAPAGAPTTDARSDARSDAQAAAADDQERSTRAPDLTWSDEDVVLDLWFAANQCVADLRRTPTALRTPAATETGVDVTPDADGPCTSGRPAPTWQAALAVRGEACATFAAAFGAAYVAAHAAARDPVSLAFTSRGTRAIVSARRAALVGRERPVRPVPRWRLAVAAFACAVGLASAAAAPGLVAVRAARRAAIGLRALGPRRVAAAAAAADLTRATEMLRTLTPADGGRPSPVRVLADVARVLPAGAALTDVQLDGAEGRLVAVAPHAAAFVAALARIPTLDGVEVVGPVTRDEPPPVPSAVPTSPTPPTSLPTPGDTAAGPRASERVAVRFRMRAPRSGPDAPVLDTRVLDTRVLGAPVADAPAGHVPVSVRPTTSRD